MHFVFFLFFFTLMMLLPEVNRERESTLWWSLNITKNDEAKAKMHTDDGPSERSTSNIRST